MRLVKVERQAVARLRDELVERFSAMEVRLFGSAARGTMDEESDIDLFVVVPHLDWDMELAMYDAAFEAGLLANRPITLSIFTAQEVEGTPLRSSALLRQVRREGKPV